MPVYSYTAADRAGKKVRATLEAANEAALKSELKEKGLIPLNITTSEGRRAFTIKRVTHKDILLFTQELGNLLESGLPIDRALYVLSEHSEKEALRSVVRQVYMDIQKGQSLSQALSSHKMFPALYVNMVRAGEVGGILEQVLRRLAEFLETSVEFREEITSALIYPILLTSVGGLAVTVLMLYVVPKFAQIFQDMGQALPGPTQLLMDVSNAFISYWWVIAGVIALIAAVLRTYARTEEGRLFIDGLKSRMPGVRGLHMKMVIARFARTLGTLLKSGVPILDAISISRAVVGNEAVSLRLKDLEDGVRKGKGVSGPLNNSGVFPSIVAQMLAVGEEAGRLEETFMIVAERFEAESRRLIKRTVGLIEPALILLMGLIVGFIVISMLIAVFSINEIPI
jgi:general secretion pathway protein F